MHFLGKKKIKIINASLVQEEMQLHKGVVAAHNCGVFFSVKMKMDQLLLW